MPTKRLACLLTCLLLVLTLPACGGNDAGVLGDAALFHGQGTLRDGAPGG